MKGNIQHLPLSQRIFTVSALMLTDISVRYLLSKASAKPGVSIGLKAGSRIFQHLPLRMRLTLRLEILTVSTIFRNVYPLLRRSKMRSISGGVSLLLGFRVPLRFFLSFLPRRSLLFRAAFLPFRFHYLCRIPQVIQIVCVSGAFGFQPPAFGKSARLPTGGTARHAMTARDSRRQGSYRDCNA